MGSIRTTARVISGQGALAAKPQMLLGFQLRHPEQEAEHVELVTPRQPGQVRGGLCNKGRSLIPAALPV